MKGIYIEIKNIPDFDEMEHLPIEKIILPNKPSCFNAFISAEKRKEGAKPNPYRDHSGIYFLMNGWELIYVGKTNHLANRIKAHDKEFNSIFFLSVESWEQDVLEQIYISMYYPKYNK
jgi:hypothetical protein